MNIGSSSKINTLVVFALAILGGIAYFNTLHSPFQFDDLLYITANQDIRFLTNIRKIFLYEPTRFVTFFTFAFNYHFGELNVFGYHLLNLLIHICNSIWVYFLVFLFMKKTNPDKETTLQLYLLPFFIALLFLLHPIQTQAVTYVWQRAASLLAFLYLGSMCLFSMGCKEEQIIKKRTYFLISWVFAVLAMFTKQNAFTLPPALFLVGYYFYPLPNNIKDYVKRYLPFFLTLFIIPLFMMFSELDVVKDMKATSPHTPWEYFMSQAHVILTYVRLVLYPVNQNLDYDYPVTHQLDFLTVGLMIALASLLLLALYLIKTHKLISFGILFFFLTLSVESSFVPLRDLIFEHRLYLPAFGLILTLSVLWFQVLMKNNKLSYLIFLVIPICMLLTHERNKVWSDSVTLWKDAVAKSPNKTRPRYNLAIQYLDKGDFQNAFKEINHVMETDPDYLGAYNILGKIYFLTSQWSKSIASYERYLAKSPNDPQVLDNLAKTYAHMKNFEKAIEIFQKSLKIEPRNVETYFKIALMYRDLGQFKESQSYLDQYLKFHPQPPNAAKAYYVLAKNYDKLGKTKEAKNAYSKCVQLDSQHFLAQKSLGFLFLRGSKFDQAIEYFKKADAIKPNQVDVLVNLGAAYAQNSDFVQAESYLEKALKIDPKRAEIYYNLAFVYEKKGRPDLAKKYLEMAP